MTEEEKKPIRTKQFGAVWIASDGIRQSVGATEAFAIEGLNDIDQARENWAKVNELCDRKEAP